MQNFQLVFIANVCLNSAPLRDMHDFEHAEFGLQLLKVMAQLYSYV